MLSWCLCCFRAVLPAESVCLLCAFPEAPLGASSCRGFLLLVVGEAPERGLQAGAAARPPRDPFALRGHGTLCSPSLGAAVPGAGACTGGRCGAGCAAARWGCEYEQIRANVSPARLFRSLQEAGTGTGTETWGNPAWGAWGARGALGCKRRAGWGGRRGKLGVGLSVCTRVSLPRGLC